MPYDIKPPPGREKKSRHQRVGSGAQDDRSPRSMAAQKAEISSEAKRFNSSIHSSTCSQRRPKPGTYPRLSGSTAPCTNSVEPSRTASFAHSKYFRNNPSGERTLSSKESRTSSSDTSGGSTRPSLSTAKELRCCASPVLTVNTPFPPPARSPSTQGLPAIPRVIWSSLRLNSNARGAPMVSVSIYCKRAARVSSAVRPSRLLSARNVAGVLSLLQ
mmetsp:Transcript_18265/g.55103  ORF Transcript_18265/g.55103 Transcript_18265/m.55103 type:complete len:216 (-) Transcript_18265:931-1578(-)